MKVIIIFKMRHTTHIYYSPKYLRNLSALGTFNTTLPLTINLVFSIACGTPKLVLALTDVVLAAVQRSHIYVAAAGELSTADRLFS